MASSGVGEKPVMVIGVDDSSHSFYALEWTLDCFFGPHAPKQLYNLVIIHAMPTASVVLGLSSPAAGDVLPVVEADLKRVANGVVAKAKELCSTKSVQDVRVEIMEGDPRNVMCEAVEKYHATILVVGSHGYGALKRAVLGSVSDYCAHHAHCSVMIVKKPKAKK